MIHRLSYCRTNHHNIHVRGYKEEGTITTPFDMTVLNDLDRFHLVMDTIDRVPQTGERGIYLKKQLRDKLIEHKRYIDLHGEDLPEIRNWMWGAKRVGRNQIADLPQNPKLGAAWRRRFVLFHHCRGKGRRKVLEPGLSVPRWLCVN